MTYEALPPAAAETTPPPVARSNDGDRAMAVLNYILLLISPFVFHTASLVAVVLAYVRRGVAPALEASHFRCQIKVFWCSILLLVASVVLALLGVGASLGAVFADGFADVWTMHWGGGAVLCFVAAGLCGLASFLWMIIGSLVGLFKLLSNQPA